VTIINDFKSLRDHMERLVQRDEARSKSEPIPPAQPQQLWCHTCGYHRTCAVCTKQAQP
jgi:hypothetical protein